jgi:hypothetical protein
VRYVRFGFGVLLSIIGSFATVGAVISGFSYLTSCLGRSDALSEQVCPSGLTETLLVGVAAVILDFGAFLFLRHRTGRWATPRSTVRVSQHASGTTRNARPRIPRP